jgi:hypothetical protein
MKRKRENKERFDTIIKNKKVDNNEKEEKKQRK